MSKPNEKKNAIGLIMAIVIVAVLLLTILLLLPGREQPVRETTAAETAGIENAQQMPEQTPEETMPHRLLKDALRIDKIGEYNGLYVEDGSDEAVSGLLMMIVTNVSAEPIQYAEISLDVDGAAAKFSVSVLPSGASAVLIEQNRMVFDEAFDYSRAAAECVHLAGFDKELSLQEELLEIQVLNGAINITNISGADIPQTILLCYKNVSNGVYHGGIAYRVRLEGGLKDGEIKQIMGNHFHQDGSEILFVDFAA